MDSDLGLQSGDGTLPRINMTEVGQTGLREIDGSVYEQFKEELRFPEASTTYKKMYNDPLIYAGLNLTMNTISKVDWFVQPHKDANEEDLKKVMFIQQCMDDMEGTWHEFIKSVLYYVVYGFSVSEKVFRRRRPSSGSKHSDNLIGWRKLAVRSQRTISKWKFDDYGRKLEGLYQDLTGVHGNGRYDKLMSSDHYTSDGLFLPKKQFLLFTYGGNSDNPEGESPLASCYTPWKFRNLLEEQEAIGISRDLNGMPIIWLHPSYLSKDADEDQKAVRKYYEDMASNVSRNEQGGAVMPLQYDENGKKVIDFELLKSGSTGGGYDIDATIKRYDDKILTALFADILKLGQGSNGSFSLAGAKTTITAVNIQARLREIADVLNNDLIRQTFEINKWDTSRLPKLAFEDLDQEDIEEFSKMIQRLGSVNMIPRTPETVSNVLKRAGFPNYEAVSLLDPDELNRLFTDNRVSASEGMKSGMPSGTGDANDNSSSLNSDNTA